MKDSEKIIETHSWFGDTSVVRLSRSETVTREALVVFHGFPGQPPKGEENNYANAPKMRVELAKVYALSTGFDAYLPSYEGLGRSRGKFCFKNSVAVSCELVKDIVARGYERVHVAGHSWGAFVAFNAHRALKLSAGKMILLAGLLDLDGEKSVRDFLPDYVKKYPEILGSDPQAFERAVADLELTRREFNPLTYAGKMSDTGALIVHGRPDSYVDVEIARRFHRKAGGRYIELEADHIFSDDAMKEVIERVVDFLSVRASS